MMLHEAIAAVLAEAPDRRLTSTEIAKVINARRLYVRPSDGGSVEAKQVAARVRRHSYRDLFEVNGSEIRLVQ